MVKAVAVLLFIKLYCMCLVVIKGEIKKSCCNCGGMCKRDQKWAEKMGSLKEGNESVDLAISLHEAQLSQHQPALVIEAVHYEESTHPGLR